MKHSEIISIIDVGSTKICCCIVRVFQEDDFEIIGIGTCASAGVKSGIIIDFELVEKSILRAVEVAEKAANIHVKSVYINISGKNVLSKIVSATIDIDNRIIDPSDIFELISTIKTKSPDVEIIHRIPVSYTVDEISGIIDPNGMFASKLSCEVNIITIPKSQLHNILICASRCNLKIIGIISSAYAAGIAHLSEEDKNLSTIVIDFGGGTTSASFFYNGIFCGCQTIPIGGIHITQDIGYAIGTTFANSERIKTLYGSSTISIADETDFVLAPIIEDDSVVTMQQFSKASINQVIQPRVEEILEKINSKIKTSIFKDNFGRSIVITGGASQLPGLKDLCFRKFNKRIKTKNLEVPTNLQNIEINNDCAVAIGMIKIAISSKSYQRQINKTEKANNNGNFIQNILSWIQKNL